jgi:predicted kinase
VQVTCDEEVTIERIRDREGISDADVEIYHEIKDSFDPLETTHVTVDNSGSWSETVAQLEGLSVAD